MQDKKKDLVKRVHIYKESSYFMVAEGKLFHI